MQQGRLRRIGVFYPYVGITMLVYSGSYALHFIHPLAKSGENLWEIIILAEFQRFHYEMQPQNFS